MRWLECAVKPLETMHLETLRCQDKIENQTLRVHTLSIIQEELKHREKKTWHVLASEHGAVRQDSDGPILDDCHHLHVSVDLIIVAGNGSSAKGVAFRTLRDPRGLVHGR